MKTQRPRRIVHIRSALVALAAAAGVLAAPVAIANADDTDSTVDAIWDDYSKKVHEIAEQNATRGFFDESGQAANPGANMQGDLAAANQRLIDALMKATGG
jgi:hypothetical protein